MANDLKGKDTIKKGLVTLSVVGLIGASGVIGNQLGKDKTKTAEIIENKQTQTIQMPTDVYETVRKSLEEKIKDDESLDHDEFELMLSIINQDKNFKFKKINKDKTPIEAIVE